MARRNKEIFAQNNKYEKNIFKRFGRWFGNLKGWQKALLIILVILVVVGIVAGSYIYGKLNKVQKVSVDESKLSCVDVDGYINILMLGVDTRDMSTIKGSGADAIMIISIKEDTGEVNLISIYRDTYMKFGDTTTYGKITDSCRIGGPELTVKSLNQAMDLNISKFAVVNFKAVSDLVNDVGGITVNVKSEEIEQLNKYTRQTANNIGQKKYNLVTQAGKQKLEGVQAVAYGRIRKGVGDDYKRTERMRIVLTKVFTKLKASDLTTVDKIINDMLSQVQTNLSNSDILGLAARLAKFNIKGSTGWPYDVAGVMLNSVSYVFPDGLADNVTKLHKEFFGQDDYTPSAKVKEISAQIQADEASGSTSSEITNNYTTNTDTNQEDSSSSNSNSGSSTTVKPSTGSDTGGSTGGDTGGSTGGNTGGSTGGSTGGGTGSGGTGTGGDTGTGGSTGGDTGSGSTGGNTGGSTGGDTGTGGGTTTDPGTGSGTGGSTVSR